MTRISLFNHNFAINSNDIFTLNKVVRSKSTLYSLVRQLKLSNSSFVFETFLLIRALKQYNAYPGLVLYCIGEKDSSRISSWNIKVFFEKLFHIQYSLFRSVVTNWGVLLYYLTGLLFASRTLSLPILMTQVNLNSTSLRRLLHNYFFTWRPRQL